MRSTAESGGLRFPRSLRVVVVESRVLCSALGWSEFRRRLLAPAVRFGVECQAVRWGAGLLRGGPVLWGRILTPSQDMAFLSAWVMGGLRRLPISTRWSNARSRSSPKGRLQAVVRASWYSWSQSVGVFEMAVA